MKYKAKCQELEKELGRYRKRCNDLMEINGNLFHRAENAEKSLMACKTSFDAWLIQTALSYGDDAKDPDTGEIIPRMKALSVPMPKISLLREYQIERRVDYGWMHIAVGLRNDPADEGKADGD